MKQSDDTKDEHEKPPKPEGKGGKIVQLRKPTPNPVFDAEWFYDEEEFFAEWMDEFDW
jgi:hypothetical protein